MIPGFMKHIVWVAILFLIGFFYVLPKLEGSNSFNKNTPAEVDSTEIFTEE